MKNRYLLARPIPRDDESPASILIRAAEGNGYETVHNMISFTGLNAKSMCLEILLGYLARFLHLISILGIRSVNPEEVLERGGPGSKTMRKMMKYFYPADFFRQDGIAYCPGCLHESQHLRKIWMFRPYSVCHIHGVPLRTTCTNCNEEMKIFRGKLCECSNCEIDIREALPDRVIAQGSWIYDFVHEGNCSSLSEFTTLFSWAKQICTKSQEVKTDNEAATLVYLYFTDRLGFEKHFLNYIASDARHTKIKLLPLFTGSPSLKKFAKEFLEGKDCGMPSSEEDLETNLSVNEAAIIHGVTTSTMQKLIRRNSQHSQFAGEPLSVGKSIAIINADIARKSAINAQDIGEFLTIPEVASLLNVHPEIVRSIQKANYLTFERHVIAGSLKYVTTLPNVETFEKTYVLVGTLARKLAVNSTDLTARLDALGIKPIATPKDSTLKTCIFSASHLQSVTKEDVLSVQKCATNAGRKREGMKKDLQKDASNVNIIMAAEQLNLSIQKVKILIEKGLLSRVSDQAPGVFVSKISMNKLLGNLNDDQFISIDAAANKLKTVTANLKREWIASGMVEYRNLIYWEQVKKSDIQRILEIKSEYVNASEAGKLLGMHRTHIRNLAKQNLITPRIFGVTKKNRLYKISDVLKFS